MTQSPETAVAAAPTIRVSELVGLRVVADEATDLGHVRDVRLRRERDAQGARQIIAVGLVLGGRRHEVRWGYDRHPGQGPLLVARLARLLHRRTGYVPWDDVEGIDLERRTVRVRASTDNQAQGRSAPRGGSS